MTARLVGHHRPRANALKVSPELQAVFKFFARLVGENALHARNAQEFVKTVSALLLCDFRIDHAAVMLSEKPVVLRMRVYRIRQRVMESLRETDWTMPVRPSIEQNLERWDPTTFDEHAELSPEAPE